MKYKINEITPKAYQCAIDNCPSIYEGVKELTPKEMQCIAAACPSINKAKNEDKEVYLIVGKNINPIEAGLEKKLGKGEALIEIPKGLIDGIVK